MSDADWSFIDFDVVVTNSFIMFYRNLDKENPNG